MKRLILFSILFFAGACHAQYSCGLPGVSISQACFNTSTAPVNLPNPIPAWGPNSTTSAGGNPYLMQTVGNLTGAGTSVTPSDFGRPMIRCTDSTFFGGIFWGFQDNGEANLFSSDDSLLLVKANGGIHYPIYIDPSGVCHPVSGLTYPNGAVFDHTIPNTTYSLQGTQQTQLYQDTLAISGCPSACAATVAVHTLLYDFNNSKCLLNSYNGNPSWSLSGGDTGLFVGSIDDNSFTEYYSDTGVGGQKGRWTVSWSKTGGGTGACAMWDTQSGLYQSQTGTQGTVTITPASSAGNTFRIHDSFQTLNPGYSVTTVGQNQMINGTFIEGSYEWQIGTANVSHCGSTGVGAVSCEGHTADGYLNIAVGKNMTMHQFLNPGTPLTAATPGGAPCADSHVSWNHDNATDGYPMIVTSQDFQSAVNLATLQSANPCAYYDEFYTGNMGSGSVLRLAHTYNSGWSWEFDQADGTVAGESASGKWAAFLSQGWGQFGSTSGNASCNIGGPNWFKNDSSDFVTGTGYGSFIMPITGNAGHYVYHVSSCTGTCTTGATAPTWPQTTTPHTTVTDNTIVWETYPDSFSSSVSAVSNCRPDIILVKLFQTGTTTNAPALVTLAVK